MSFSYQQISTEHSTVSADEPEEELIEYLSFRANGRYALSIASVVEIARLQPLVLRYPSLWRNWSIVDVD